MRFEIYKKPAKVLLIGLAGFGLYFAIAVALFTGNSYYYLILGAGVFGIAILLAKSIGSAFVSSLTVTESSIERVTSVGGIIKINFNDLDLERSVFSGACLLLTPHDGESILVSAAEYSRPDILKLANHIADNYGKFQNCDSRGEA